MIIYECQIRIGSRGSHACKTPPVDEATLSIVSGGLQVGYMQERQTSEYDCTSHLRVSTSELDTLYTLLLLANWHFHKFKTGNET